MTKKRSANDYFTEARTASLSLRLLFNGKRIISEQPLIEVAPVSMYKADGNLHEQERDVAKYWILENNKRINVRIAFLGIENQTVYDKDMPLRAFSYDGAAYRAELSTAERYPVITLILYFGDDPWGKNRSLYDLLDQGLFLFIRLSFR